ncbi:hypothetical protein BKA80DRAFT_3241 [Phyllosticta citrichinensis]
MSDWTSRRMLPNRRLCLLCAGANVGKIHLHHASVQTCCNASPDSSPFPTAHSAQYHQGDMSIQLENLNLNQRFKKRCNLYLQGAISPSAHPSVCCDHQLYVQPKSDKRENTCHAVPIPFHSMTISSSSSTITARNHRPSQPPSSPKGPSGGRVKSQWLALSLRCCCC